MAQQQDNTQAQASAAAFTHTPRDPAANRIDARQRTFCSPYLPTYAGENVGVMRWEHEQKAQIRIQTCGRQDVIAETITSLTAEQCEALARSLIDAAHDLRAHPAADLMVNRILALSEDDATQDSSKVTA